MEESKGVYIAVLNQGHIRPELSYLITELTHQNKYRLHVTYPADKPISFNRNKIVKDFLKKKEFDYLLMIDSDIIPPTNILDLVDHQQDIMSPVCFAYMDGAVVPLVLKEYDEEEKKNHNAPYHVQEMDGTEGMIETDAVGTGCMIIKREVVEALKDDNPFNNRYDKQGMKTLGLDLSFCMKAKKLGYKVWCHLDLVCSHWTEVDLKTIYTAVRKANEIKIQHIKEEKNEVQESTHNQ
jgi:hypothetical protein